ncbi:glycoside hydrolase family 9 protein [Maribacter sp. 2307ULW6-5]|uniref:glycoside hydrolase family 9 protein n=1 Tax=Maribacter sp. 2307ULW6-5 TaxID=3386275 RepID=UPI0039BCEFF9
MNFVKNNLTLIFFWLMLPFAGTGQQSTEIRINLQGYRAEMPKTARIMSHKKLRNHTLVLKNKDGQTVKAFRAQKEKTNWHPFSHYYSVDFSELTQPGDYYFEVKNGNAKSHSFTVGAYPKWQEDIVDFIRTQRCGYNPHIKAFCHQNDGLSFFGKRPDSTRIDATGGWHDAGDQLKYLITSSNTTARLLMAYQMAPDRFRDEVDARGHKGPNGLPDVLDEAKWGLEWILKMHPSADELYHQVADDRDHRGFKLPPEDNADYGWGANSFRPVYFATGQPQGLSKYKSKATGIANLAGRSAATLALGHQVLRGFPQHLVFAEQCKEAAIELYQMGQKQEGYQQGNSFGAPYRYEENTWADDMEWAAAKLYELTKEEQYLEDTRRYAKTIGAWSWMERDTASHYEMYPYVNMGHYALWKVGNEEDKKQTVAYFEQNLENIQARAQNNPYGVGHLFIWCSNNLAAAVATQAMLYEEMTGSKKYRPLMQHHVDWLLGTNPWNSSMITEIPANADTPVDVHMPFWRINQDKIKGGLVDGPLWATVHTDMIGIQLSKPDEFAHLQPKHVKYHDDWADYSTNEPTLDGSAELLMLFTFLSND